MSRTIAAVLLLVIGINPATLYLFIPAMPAIQTAFDVSTSTVQLSLSLALAAMTPATLLYGPFSDAYGRRRTLLVASLLIAAGSGLAALASSIGVLIVGRVVQACGAAAGPVLASSIVFDLYGDERAGPVLAQLVAGMVVAMMITPVLGGLLTDHEGWRSTFVLSCVLGAALLAATWRVLPETRQAPDPASVRPAELLRGYTRLLRHPVYLGYALMAAFSMAISYAFLSAAPHVLIAQMGGSASEFGFWLLGVAAGFIAGNLAAARWTDSLGRTRMILVGGTLSLAACAALTIALTVWAPTRWAMFGPAIVAAAACGLAMPNAEAALLGVIPELSGSASALESALVLVISAITSQVVGALLGETPFPLGISMTAAAALALTSFVASLAYQRWRKPPPAASQLA
jgi:DHA1 family bicyclomycin/chloramphenicol resistance-like MFS transporter